MTPDEQTVERVAKAIREQNRFHIQRQHPNLTFDRDALTADELRLARAAISAMPDIKVSEPAMVGCDECGGKGCHNCGGLGLVPEQIEIGVSDIEKLALRVLDWGNGIGSEIVAATLRAQAARIAELEAENAILRTEKHADAEAIASARNDALREARNIADAAMKKYAKATYSGEPVKVFKAGDDTNSHSAAKCYCAGEILIEIDALTKGSKQ